MPDPEAHLGHHHHLAVGVAFHVGRVVGSPVELHVIDQDVEADIGHRPLPQPGLLIWSHGPIDNLARYDVVWLGHISALMKSYITSGRRLVLLATMVRL